MRVMERLLVVESPDVYRSGKMQAYITQQASRPCKQWIHEVLSAKLEAERVKLRTDSFVLLPDVDAVNKRVYGRVEHQFARNDLPFSSHAINSNQNNPNQNNPNQNNPNPNNPNPNNPNQNNPNLKPKQPKQPKQPQRALLPQQFRAALAGQARPRAPALAGGAERARAEDGA